MSWIPDRAADPAAPLALLTPVASASGGLLMCRLDFRAYSAAPYLYPMFKVGKLGARG
jgi:hypothetical protein